MSKKGRRHEAALIAPSAPQIAAPTETGLRIRFPAGRFAISAPEAEVRLGGVRIAGGNGSFEFDLAMEAWVDIVVRD